MPTEHHDTGPGPPPGAPTHLDAEHLAALERYWRANVTIMVGLLSVWAVAGLGCGVLLADTLGEFRLAGYPVGFWFAQQGSIITFVLLILVYAVALNRLERRHHAEVQRIEATQPERSR